MDTEVHTRVAKKGVFLRCAQRRDARVWSGCAYAAWAFLGGAVMVCLPFSAQAQAARDYKYKPAWNVPEAASRMVVEKEQDDFFLVQLPVKVAGQPVSGVRTFVVSNEVPSRVVWVDTNLVTVLIDARSAKHGQGIKVYPVPGSSAVAPGPSTLADPAPLRGCARRTAGMDFPANLADVKTLETRCDTKPDWFTVSEFNKLGTTFKDWFRGDWTRKSHLVDLQTWLLVPSDGKYLFGLAGVSPAWLLIDGRPVLEHPSNQPYDKWTAGSELPLKAGLRQVQVRTVCRQEIDTGLAWKRAGEQGVAKDVVMLTGGDLRDGRWERRDRLVHPYATAASGEAYRFAGLDEVFVPFILTDGTSCWCTNHVVRWQIAGRVVGEGEKLRTTLRSSQLPAPLRVLAKGDSGEEAVYETSLAYDGPVWSQAEVSSRPTDLPAVCYADDRVHPMIRVRTTAADGLVYDLASVVARVDGTATNQVNRVVTDKGWARVYLDEMEAGKIDRFSWSLRHCGVEISKGCVRFLREPYEVLPDAVSGEALKAGADFVVLIASKASRGDPEEPAEPEGTNGVVLLDGFLRAASVRPDLRSPSAAKWRIMDLQDVEQSETASGMSLLLPFAALKGFMPASVAVYAPSLFGVSREGGLAGFERRLSAMTGLLNSPASGSPRVLMVVPPAFDVLPGCGCVPGDKPCVHAAEARSYAEAVVRIADVHGVETVDLFTAFQTAGSDVPLVKNGVLTPAGIALAETLIEKKIALP